MMKRTGFRLLGTVALTLAAGACIDHATPTEAVYEPQPSSATAAATERIPDRYVVVFRADTRDAPGLARRLTAEHGGTLHHTYQHALRGFAATLSPRAAEALRANPNVAYIEQDQEVRTSDVTQFHPPSWGLDRIDQFTLPLSQTYTYRTTGQGVTVYVIDTGIETSHPEFGGRAWAAYDAFGGTAQDCNGHGTHVAGTVGGTGYGVAKGVALAAVRVLPCSGPGAWSSVIAGIDWVRYYHTKPAVANLSLAGGAMQSVDDALRNLIASGVTAVVAAGNDYGANACNTSPARVAAAITVGATFSNDQRATYSNIGPCLDLFAPGDVITSAWLYGGSNTINGTSMAAPHVAGVAAMHLETEPWASPGAVAQVLVNNSWQGMVTDEGWGSTRRLLSSEWVTAERNVLYRAYVSNSGWLNPVTDRQLGGTTGQALALQAVTIQLTNMPAGVGIAYQAHVANIGWQPTVYDGQVAGTTGQSLPMQAIAISLTNPQPGMRVCYEAHVAYLGWLGEVCDGQVAGTVGESRDMQALRIRIIR
jgi:hypothetical protein